MARRARQERAAGKDETVPGLSPRFIIADPRKFSHYVLDPANADGKDQIFVNKLGYRSRNQEDARTLSTIYVEQAKSKIEAGSYGVGRQDKHGQRYLIPIELGDLRLRSVWILRADGVLALVTPFSGFVRDHGEGQVWVISISSP